MFQIFVHYSGKNRVKILKYIIFNRVITGKMVNNLSW
jgi:hypothetical protein